MNIGLIADSHIPASTRVLPEQVFHAFRGVGMILHAGDIYTAGTLDALEAIAPVIAVGGPIDLAIGPPRVLERRVVAVEGIRVGLVHQLTLAGLPFDVLPGAIGNRLEGGAGVREGLCKLFGQDVDVCVFGDTHHHLVETHEGVLLVNPGSPTLPRQFMRLGTVGLLQVEQGRYEATVLELSEYPGPPPVYV